jgi:hypothetical protein
MSSEERASAAITICSLARPPRDLQGVVAANAAMGGVKNYGPEDKQTNRWWLGAPSKCLLSGVLSANEGWVINATVKDVNLDDM